MPTGSSPPSLQPPASPRSTLSFSSTSHPDWVQYLKMSRISMIPLIQLSRMTTRMMVRKRWSVALVTPHTHIPLLTHISPFSESVTCPTVH
ncbi:hypothetical protein UPYG_G00249740 [Umbra pygmaea]|uniref:Uncharacterized protein n=1 Tax=Umbra pygmaea TaxID=75934 RepID=A0ABD0W7A8_UMBPY